MKPRVKFSKSIFLPVTYTTTKKINWSYKKCHFLLNLLENFNILNTLKLPYIVHVRSIGKLMWILEHKKSTLKQQNKILSLTRSAFICNCNAVLVQKLRYECISWYNIFWTSFWQCPTCNIKDKNFDLNEKFTFNLSGPRHLFSLKSSNLLWGNCIKT